MATQEKILCVAKGNVKFSGFNHGAQNWKTGGIQVLQDDGGKYSCRMFFNAGYPKVFPLSNNLKKTCTFVASNPGRCIVHLKDTNLSIDRAPGQDVAKLIQTVNSLKGPKTPSRPLNGLRKSPNTIARSTPSWTGKSPSVVRKTPMSQSRLFSQFGDKEENDSPINVQDFEKEPMTKVPLFLEEDDENVNKENMGEAGFVSSHGSIKKTPFQMRKEEGSNIFLQSAEEKLNLLREKKNNESNQISSSFYGRGQMMSSYASADRFKNIGSNIRSSPKLLQYTPSSQKPKAFSFKPKTSAAKFVSKTAPFQTKALQGFSNLGNTCYMNAILQSLYGLDGFRDQLVQSQASENIPADSLSHAIKILFGAKLKNKPRDMIRQLLLRVKSAISKSATRFSGYLQHDAQEFLCQCMDQLKEDTERLNRSLCELMGEDDPQLNALKLQSPTAGNLEFSVMHTIQCLECGEEVHKEEMFHDLSLDMPRRSKLHPSTIQVALDQFFESEDIDYSCEKCEGKEARLSHKFTKLSRYIILNLKRYVYNLDSSRNGKVQENIEIPKYLTVSRHCMTTVEKPGGQATPTDGAVMALPASPRRKLSFEAPDRSDYGRSSKRQKVDLMEIKDSSDEGDPLLLISDIDSGEEKPAEKDFTSMTEEEQLAYALKLSESETKRKPFSIVPIEASPLLKHNNSGARRDSSPASMQGDRVVPSAEGGDSRDPPREVRSDVTSVDTAGNDKTETATGESWEGNDEISGTTDNEDEGIAMANVDMETAKCENRENVQIENRTGETNDETQPETVDINSGGEGLPRQAEEGVVTFNLDLDSSTGEGVYQTRKDVNLVSPMRGVEESDSVSGPEPSTEDLRAKEEEELRKATELSLQDQNDANLREEEQIRKAQELSLQEYQRTSPPAIAPPEVREETPKQPLYTDAEWRQLERNAKEGDMPNTYQLVSVVSHMGSSLSVGHYVSDVYDSKTKKWLSYDDSNVAVIPAAKVREDRRRTGYIFFYEKVS